MACRYNTRAPPWQDNDSIETRLSLPVVEVRLVRLVNEREEILTLLSQIWNEDGKEIDPSVFGLAHLKNQVGNSRSKMISYVKCMYIQTYLRTLY
jgi:hypothetical protein